MRDNINEYDIRIRPGYDVSLLYVDLQRVQDRNTLRDRQLTAVSLGLTINTKGTATTVTNEPARTASAIIERRLSTISHLSHSESINDEFEGGEEKVVKPTPVRYHRLDDRLRFANTLVAANPADIIVIDSWPEECLMKNYFPAFDDHNEEESYVTKTAFRPNGGRGTMIAVKRRCLMPEDDRHTNIGLISLERLVKRNWTPTPFSQGGCNQAWVHAVDAGPACCNQNKQPIRLAIVVYDCGRGYPFQNGLNDMSNQLAKTTPSLFSSRLFLSCRSSAISLNNDQNVNQRIPPTQAVRSVVGSYETKTTLLRATRSNSSIGPCNYYRNGHGNEPPNHIWWRGSTTMPNGNGARDTVVEGSTGPPNGTITPKMERKKSILAAPSWIDNQTTTSPMDDAEERIRIAGELKQLKSFLVVTLANQISDPKRRHLERRGSETSLDRFNNSHQVTNGAVALIVGRFGVNSLPLAQSLASCVNTPMANQDCQITVCDNDRCETMAALWWRPKNRHNNSINNHSNGHSNNNGLSTSNGQDHQSNNGSLGESEDCKNGNRIHINDTTAMLDYDRNEWLEAEFECRPRMFTVAFH